MGVKKAMVQSFRAVLERDRRSLGWVLGVKSEEARLRRAEQMAERLMLTTEGMQEREGRLSGRPRLPRTPLMTM